MLRAAVIFFVLGLSVFLLGIYGMADVSLKAGKLFLIVFISLSFLSFIAAITTEKSPDRIYE